MRRNDNVFTDLFILLNKEQNNERQKAKKVIDWMTEIVNDVELWWKDAIFRCLIKVKFEKNASFCLWISKAQIVVSLHRLPLLGRWRIQRWQCNLPWPTSSQAACECSYNLGLFHPNASYSNILLPHRTKPATARPRGCWNSFWEILFSPGNGVFGPGILLFCLSSSVSLLPF